MATGLKGKTVLINAATRKHGEASALAFAREGTNLLRCTRQSMNLLEDTADLARASEVRVVTELREIEDICLESEEAARGLYYQPGDVR